MTNCEHIDTAASYVLGALPDPEVEPFVAHLATCAHCRREVAELTLAANALPLTAPPAAPPPELRGRIMTVVHSEAELLAAAGPEADRPPRPAKAKRAGLRERFGQVGFSLRPAVAALAAGFLVAVGVAGALVATRDDGTQTVPAAVKIASAPNAAATLTTDRGGHSQLRVRNMPQAGRARVYQVWLKRRGQRNPTPSTALFTVDRTGHAEVSVPENTKDAEEVLVTREPDGGSDAPTSPPVIVATKS
ncbi:MAG: anti-sigma factor [Solirubrobacteraceae bacterium]